MPVVTAEVFVPVDMATAFAVSQLTDPIRRRWDPFISDQHHLDGAEAPANAGMVIDSRPWFFEKLGGG